MQLTILISNGLLRHGIYVIFPAGSDIAGETSALFSAGTLLFQTVNDTYASILLDHAKSLYTFANQYRGKYSDSVPEATPFYT